MNMKQLIIKFDKQRLLPAQERKIVLSILIRLISREMLSVKCLRPMTCLPP